MQERTDCVVRIEECHVSRFFQGRVIPQVAPKDWNLCEDDIIHYNYASHSGQAKVLSARPLGTAQTICQIQRLAVETGR